MTNQEIRKAKRQQKIHRRNWLLHFLFIITIALILCVISNQNYIMEQQAIEEKMHQDTLNTLNLMWQDMDKLASAEPYYPLTDEERDCIERTVSAESRGEPYEGQMAVAQTIRDRAIMWGMPISEVLSKNQFAPPYQGEISDSVKMAITETFDNGTSIFKEPITHFYSGSEPYWAENKINRGSISRHTFMY